MDVGTLFLIGVGLIVLLVVFVLLDLFFAGGAGTMGMMHGAAMTPALATSASAGASVASNPIGQAILLVLLAILGVLVYAVFFR
jgi:hypothetical protein